MASSELVIMLGGSEVDMRQEDEGSSYVWKAPVMDLLQVDSKESEAMRYGACSAQGWRSSMEDEYRVEKLADELLFVGVYDGHGGKEVSKFCSDNLHKELVARMSNKEACVEDCLRDTFMSMDKMMSGMSEVGSTATVALVYGQRKVVVANLGDCRCVLSKKGIAIDLSRDHSPDLEAERQRIEEAGGYVEKGRVQSTSSSRSLGVSRAIGDFEFKANPAVAHDKQLVTSVPEVMEVDIQPEIDEFMVVASDGIWGCRSSQQVVNFVRERLEADPTIVLSNVCKHLIESCLESRSRDNMSVVIVKLSRV